MSRLHEAFKECRHLRGPFVICNADGSPKKVSQMRKVLPRLCARAGIEEYSWHPLRHTFCSHLAMNLVEESKREREKYSWMRERPLYVYKPTGRLSLQIHTDLNTRIKHRWTDGKRQRVERMLPKFVIAALEIADAIKKDRVEREERRRKQEAWEQQRHGKLAEISREEKKLELLERHSAAWHEAETLRGYIAALERMVATEQVTTIYEEEPAAFLEWARPQAARIDPLVVAPRSILDEKDKWSYRRYW